MEDIKNKKRILICGGGIGGFALGQYLLQHRSEDFDFEIIEKDIEFTSRKQGYSLTIQSNGQKALQQICKIASFDELLKTGVALKGRGQTRYNINDCSLISKSNEAKKDLHYFIPRQEVRRVLIEGIESKITWGVWVESFSIRDDESIEVNFGSLDKKEEMDNKKKKKSCVYDCIVNCEGLYSRMRTTLTGREDLIYLNTIMLNGIVPNLDAFYEEKRSYIFEGDSQVRLFFKPYQRGELMWQLTVTLSIDQAKDICSLTPDEQLKYSLRCIDNIKEQPIYQMMKQTSLELIRCGLLQSRSPLQATDCAQFQSITFLGDSAHPMPPFKGQGANQALEDAVDLGRILNPDRISESLRVFERIMFKRANYYQEESVKRVQDFHENL